MSAIHSVSNRALLAAVPAGMMRRFDPGAAGNLDATLELRSGGTRFAIRVTDGRCSVTRRRAPEAGAYVALSPGDIARLITGGVRWPVLLASERLELGGDPFLALRFPSLFGFSSAR
jgi:hypothetical protein